MFSESTRWFEFRSRQLVKVPTIIAAVGLALCVAGCFGGDDDDEGTEGSTQGRPELKLVESTVIKGGQRREQALLRRVVAAMEKTTLTRIEIGALDGRREVDGGAAVPIAFTSGRGQSVRRQWDQWVVAGGFSRRLDAAGLDAQVDAGDRSGGFTARPKVKGQPDPRPLTRAREAALVKRIRSAATRSGAEIVRLEVHRPYGPAVALSLAADDPARFLKSELRQLMERLAVDRSRLEGLYLAVLGENQLVLEWGSWTRNPAGSYWVRRDLANCSPIRQSDPPGTKPPPACPV